MHAVASQRVGVRGRGSLTERLDYRLRCLRAREVLLTGDEVAVSDREAAPQPSLDVVSAERFQLVLDPPGHDVFVARQRAHVPHGTVSEVLLDVGEAGDRLPLDERLAVRQTGV